MRIMIGLSTIAMTAALYGGVAQAQTLDIGGAGVDLGGDGSTVTVDTGGSEPAASVNVGGADNTDATVDVDLGGGTPGGGVLDLGGGADASIGTDGNLVDVGHGTNGDVNLTLFGDGTSDGTVQAAGQDVTLDLLGTGNGTDADVLVSLFGDGAGDADISIGLGGAVETSSPGGGDGGAGGNGASGGTGIFGGGSTGLDLGTSSRVAALGNDDCFTPNTQQISYLVNSRDYGPAMTARWSSANNVDLVPVRLCPEAHAQVEAAVEADADIQWLQAAVERDPRIAAELRGAGLDGDNVLALDNKAGNLAVYVY